MLERAVAEVVRQQAEIGIDIVSDGEFGKNVSWSRYVLERLSGLHIGIGRELECQISLSAQYLSAQSIVGFQEGAAQASGNAISRPRDD
jgi:methionine synthase II (cobalamin-independent)